MAKSTTVMQLALIFTLLSVTFKADDNTGSNQASLCLHINYITLTGIKWKSEMQFANPEGILYAFDPIDSVDTFQQFVFPIVPTTADDAGKVVNTFPTQFNFKDDALSVFCWSNPSIMALSIRFKLYSFYHTALKAVSEVQIPFKQDAPTTICVDLSTLPYQYANANVSVNFTLERNTQQPVLAKVPIKSPPIPPVQPPVDAEAVMDVMTDHIIADERAKAGNMEDGAPLGEHETSSDWMFTAALCSSILGLFVLVYICVWGYRSYGRKEYETIPSNVNSSNLSMVGRKRKISLRNIGIDKDQNADSEQKNIMHPSASYTFQDE